MNKKRRSNISLRERNNSLKNDQSKMIEKVVGNKFISGKTGGVMGKKMTVPVVT